MFFLPIKVYLTVTTDTNRPCKCMPLCRDAMGGNKETASLIRPTTHTMASEIRLPLSLRNPATQSPLQLESSQLRPIGH